MSEYRQDIPRSNQQPLAEVFGFPLSNTSARADRYREHKLCPFHNVVSTCTKNSLDFPLGVCSINHKNKPVIVCPVRFREDWTIMSDVAGFMFEKGQPWAQISEIKLTDKHGKPAGNIDYVLVAYDDKGRILDFGSFEVQSVYISGNLTGPFQAYLENPTPDFTWTQSLKYPKPDYLSSSRKRLIPQIIAKGSILHQWGKKQAVALQASFFQTLPKLPETSRDEADFAFFLYDLLPDETSQILRLSLTQVIYTHFHEALEQIARFEAGSLSSFTAQLQRRLDVKIGSGENPDRNPPSELT